MAVCTDIPPWHLVLFILSICFSHNSINVCTVSLGYFYFVGGKRGSTALSAGFETAFTEYYINQFYQQMCIFLSFSRAKSLISYKAPPLKGMVRSMKHELWNSPVRKGTCFLIAKQYLQQGDVATDALACFWST